MEKEAMVELAVLKQQYENLRKGHDDTVQDMKEIKDSIGAINISLALLAESAKKTQQEGAERERELQNNYKTLERHTINSSDATQGIYSTIQEMKASQEIIYNNAILVDKEQDTKIENLSEICEKINRDVKQLSKEMIEQSNKTKIDLSEILGKSINSVLENMLKVGIIASAIYALTKLK